MRATDKLQLILYAVPQQFVVWVQWNSIITLLLRKKKLFQIEKYIEMLSLAQLFIYFIFLCVDMQIRITEISGKNLQSLFNELVG